MERLAELRPALASVNSCACLAAPTAILIGFLCFANTARGLCANSNRMWRRPRNASSSSRRSIRFDALCLSRRVCAFSKSFIAGFDSKPLDADKVRLHEENHKTQSNNTETKKQTRLQRLLETNTLLFTKPSLRSTNSTRDTTTTTTPSSPSAVTSGIFEMIRLSDSSCLRV